MGKIIDLIGKKYGRLTVISLAEKPKESKSTSKFWLCECECGNKKIISGNVLKQGKSKSCGCLNTEMRPTEDLTNKRFGQLTVIKRVPKPEHLKSNGAYWLCKCDCGKEKIIMAKSLKQGHTTSCGGCRINIVDDLTNQTFGLLTAIERDFSKESTNNGAFWKCKCACGNETIVSGKNLKHGNTKSCGCLISIGEQYIKQLLSENKITFKQQYSFTDLKSRKNFPLRFDFAIFNQNNEIERLIEFQGEQHYLNSGSQFFDLTILETDKQKEDYCFKNNIKLIQIPYWKRDSLKLEDIMTDKYCYKRMEVEE